MRAVTNQDCPGTEVEGELALSSPLAHLDSSILFASSDHKRRESGIKGNTIVRKHVCDDTNSRKIATRLDMKLSSSNIDFRYLT